MRVLRYVLIPCDDSIAPCEQTVELDDASEGDVLRAHLSPHFREGSVDPTAVAQQLGSLSQSIDLSVLEQGTVETFPLTRPSEANGNAAVTLYLDESGVLKNKPRNERASRLAADCGHAAPLHGDIFVGREQLRGRGREPVDFTLADLSSSAKWMAAALQQNFEHAVATKKMHADMEGTFQHINLGEGADGAGLPSGSADGYSWCQTKSDLELRVPLPSSLKARDCKVKFATGTITVAIGASAAVLDGARLQGKVVPDECTWSIAGEGDERALVVTLEKATEGGWQSLLSE